MLQRYYRQTCSNGVGVFFPRDPAGSCHPCNSGHHETPAVSDCSTKAVDFVFSPYIECNLCNALVVVVGDASIFRQRCSGDSGKCSQQVCLSNQAAESTAGRRNTVWPSDKERNSVAAFIDVTFAAPVWTVAVVAEVSDALLP